MPAGSPPSPHGSTLFEALWRYRIWVIATALIAAAAGYASSLQQPAVYEASSRLLLADPRDGGIYGETAETVEPNRHLRNKAEIAQSAPVLDLAADRLDGTETAQSLAARVTVIPAVDRDLLVITARAGTAREAAEISNSVAAAYQEHEAEASREQADRSIAELNEALSDLQADLDDTERLLAEEPTDDGLAARRGAIINQQFTLRTRVQQITTDVALVGSGVELFEEAVPPTLPAGPLPLRAALVASVLTSVVAAMASWWAANRRPDVTHRRDYDHDRDGRRRDDHDGHDDHDDHDRDEVPAAV